MNAIGPETTAALRVLAFVAGAGLVHLVLAAGRGVLRRGLTSSSSALRRFAAVSNVVVGQAVWLGYLCATGLALGALGLPAAIVLGAAAVLAIVVAIGAPGVVRDVTTGLALALSNRLDAGTLVAIGGHVGTVERVDPRFTVLAGPTGTRILVPNRTITDIVAFPAGYLSVVLDVALPDDRSVIERAMTEVRRVLDRSFEQFGNVMRAAPAVLGRETTATGSYVRVELKLWPDQGSIIDRFVKPALAAAMRPLTPGYKDWMIVAHQQPAGAAPRVKADDDRRMSRRALLTLSPRARRPGRR